MSAFFRPLGLIAALLLLAAGLAACDNTIRGFGEDVQDTGAPSRRPALGRQPALRAVGVHRRALRASRPADRSLPRYSIS